MPQSALSFCYFQAFVRYVFNHCITVCHCSDENELEEAFPLLQTSFNFWVCWNVVEDTSLAFLGVCECTASPPSSVHGSDFVLNLLHIDMFYSKYLPLSWPYNPKYEEAMKQNVAATGNFVYFVDCITC